MGAAVADSTLTSAIGRAGTATRAAVVLRVAAPPTSSTVPHAWHSPQRPAHFAVVQPHSAQRNCAALLRLAVADEELMCDKVSDGTDTGPNR
ncbi:hypothetical protein GCM10027344_06360 [Spelaeicoccus albus]